MGRGKGGGGEMGWIDIQGKMHKSEIFSSINYVFSIFLSSGTNVFD